MNKWNSFKKALNTCLEYNGMVYGGAVRDLILHNSHAREFLKTNDHSEYTDETIRPDTLGRLVIPNDIDCLMHEKDSKTFMKYVSRHHFLKVIEVTNVYFNNNNNYKHLKLFILFYDMNIVKIDLIIQLFTDDLKLPWYNLDFDVNGLILTSNGVELTKFLRDKGNAISNTDM